MGSPRNVTTTLVNHKIVKVEGPAVEGEQGTTVKRVVRAGVGGAAVGDVSMQPATVRVLRAVPGTTLGGQAATSTLNGGNAVHSAGG